MLEMGKHQEAFEMYCVVDKILERVWDQSHVRYEYKISSFKLYADR